MNMSQSQKYIITPEQYTSSQVELSASTSRNKYLKGERSGERIRRMQDKLRQYKEGIKHFKHFIVMIKDQKTENNNLEKKCQEGEPNRIVVQQEFKRVH